MKETFKQTKINKDRTNLPSNRLVLRNRQIHRHRQRNRKTLKTDRQTERQTEKQIISENDDNPNQV